MLSAEDIRLLLKLVGEETVVEPSEKFPYRVSKEGFGYSNDPQRGRVQAALSMMLEMASKREV
jgi:hypothetical protein